MLSHESVAVLSHDATSRKIDRAERSRRVATRIWCTPMGVVPALAGPDQWSITSSSCPRISAMLSDSGWPGSTAGAPKCRGVAPWARAVAIAAAANPARGTDRCHCFAICAASSCSSASGPSSVTRQIVCSVATPRNAPERMAMLTGALADGTVKRRRWPENAAMGANSAASRSSRRGDAARATVGVGVAGGQGTAPGPSASSRHTPWSRQSVCDCKASVPPDVSCHSN